MSKLFLLSCVLLMGTLTHAMVNPDIEWRRSDSLHFEIIFNVEHHELAMYCLKELEEIRQEIGRYYSEQPEKTLVVLNDQTDQTNGFATRVPYPYMMIYPTLPGPNESLADYGKWFRELLAHEYAHVLSFEPAPGPMGALRYVFGSIISPNLLLPRWWKEGQSVLVESTLSHGGRLRSPYQEGVLRALKVQNQLEKYKIDKANEFLDYWPEGHAPYLFGSLFWATAKKKKGNEVVNNLTQGHGGQIPYILSDVAQKYLGSDYEAFYEEAIHETQVGLEKQIQQLRTAPVTPFRRVKAGPNTTYAHSARVNPSGKNLVAITVDETDTRSLQFWEKKDDQDHFWQSKPIRSKATQHEEISTVPILDGPPTGSIQRVEWFWSHPQVVFDKSRSSSPYESRSDLYTYNLNTGTTRQLTQNLRAREPAMGPQDDLITYVQIEAGKTSLALIPYSPQNPDPHKSVPISKEQRRILFSGKIGERVSQPFFLSQKEIAFAFRNEMGTEQVGIYNLELQKVTWLHLPTPARAFRQSSGTYYFGSAKNGVWNIYTLTDLQSESSAPLTHSLTGVTNCDHDPLAHDWICTMMTAEGPSLVSLSEEHTKKTPKELPKVQPLFDEPFQEPTLKTQVGSAEREYSSTEYLLPRYWIPLVSGVSSSGGWIFSAQTSGQDPLSQQAYSALGIIDTATNRGSYALSYSNQMTHVPFLVSHLLQNSYLGSTSFEIRDQTTSVFALPNLWDLSSNLRGQIGWTYNLRSSLGSEIKRTGPQLSLEYRDIWLGGAQVSPTSGWGAYFQAIGYLQQPGYYNHSQYFLSGQTYISKYLPKFHSIFLKLNLTAIPEEVPNYHGTFTSSQNLAPNATLTQFLIRGYDSGQFYGRNLVNWNMEYRFPLQQLNWGKGTLPFFIRRLHGSLVVDGLKSDGRALTTSAFEVLDFSKTYWGAGAELKMDTTLGYVIPLTFVFGSYWPLNPMTGNRPNFSFNFVLAEN